MLILDTPEFNVTRTYDAPPAFTLEGSFHGYAGYDDNGMPFVASGFELRDIEKKKPAEQRAFERMVEERTQEMLAAANLKAIAAQQQLIMDVKAIETFNLDATFVNGRVQAVLERVAGLPPAASTKNALRVWWYDHLGYRYEPPPKLIVAVNAVPQLSAPRICTCFVAGTPVQTVDGPQPIEGIRVGDLVLSQDVTTGSLEFAPVLVVHHNSPGATLRISLSNHDTLVSSVYHRFWRPGRGWALARELTSGDLVRCLTGVVQVAAVEPGTIEPLYNLDVAQKQLFCRRIGRAGS